MPFDAITFIINSFDCFPNLPMNYTIRFELEPKASTVDQTTGRWIHLEWLIRLNHFFFTNTLIRIMCVKKVFLCAKHKSARQPAQFICVKWIQQSFVLVMRIIDLLKITQFKCYIWVRVTWRIRYYFYTFLLWTCIGCKCQKIATNCCPERQFYNQMRSITLLELFLHYLLPIVHNSHKKDKQSHLSQACQFAFVSRQKVEKTNSRIFVDFEAHYWIGCCNIRSP